MLHTETLADEVKHRMAQRVQLIAYLSGLVGPTSDRQLARAIGAHGITLRRTIRDGAGIKSKRQPLHASRDEIIAGIDEHLPRLTRESIARLLRGAADAIEAGGVP